MRGNVLADSEDYSRYRTPLSGIAENWSAPTGPMMSPHASSFLMCSAHFEDNILRHIVLGRGLHGDLSREKHSATVKYWPPCIRPRQILELYGAYS